MVSLQNHRNKGRDIRCLSPTLNGTTGREVMSRRTCRLVGAKTRALPGVISDSTLAVAGSLAASAARANKDRAAAKPKPKD